MKKSLLALAVLGAFAGAASAQSSVTLSGVLDVGATYTSDPAVKWGLGRGDNNRIAFNGAEDLGGGLFATFGAQMRFEPDTGTQEVGGARPLFQGETRVGLRGGFGQIRLGRGLTAVQDPNGGFDPFGVATVGALQGQLTAFYNSEDASTSAATGVGTPLPGGEGRWRNAVFYNSPNLGGFVANVTAQAVEGNTNAGVRPISVSGVYGGGPISVMLGYERNNLDTKYVQFAGAYNFGFAKIMASYATNDPLGIRKLKGYGVGVVAPVGPARIKVGYAVAQTNAVGVVDSKKGALGVDYLLSKRTYIYTDIAKSKGLGATVSRNLFDLGIRHAF
jgi:predicted porin